MMGMETDVLGENLPNASPSNIESTIDCDRSRTWAAAVGSCLLIGWLVGWLVGWSVVWLLGLLVSTEKAGTSPTLHELYIRGCSTSNVIVVNILLTYPSRENINQAV
jgi:hypothetical protein